MAETLTSTPTAVGTSAVSVYSGTAKAVKLRLANNGAATFFIGPADVTTATGTPVAAGSYIDINQSDGSAALASSIFAVAAAAGGDCRTIVWRQ